MEILGSYFDLKFDQTLAPSPSLSIHLKIKLHLRNKSSTIVEFMIKFIWKHKWNFIALSKCHLEGWIFATNGTPPQTPEQTVKEVSPFWGGLHLFSWSHEQGYKQYVGERWSGIPSWIACLSSQLVRVDKCLSIFLCQMEAILYRNVMSCAIFWQAHMARQNTNNY